MNKLMEWRRRSGGDHAYFRTIYRHTKRIGYKVPCPNVHLIASCCVLCRDSGEIGFFRAERMRMRERKK